ncbi:hypothetical protein LINPERHAP2_LOCUS39411 [Linum perenne]
MFDIGPMTPSGVEALIARFVRKPVDFDEFLYDDHDVLCHCGLKASRRISHTPADNGCGYFDWLDDKVAALNNKIALVSALNDKIALVSIVQQLESKVHHLQSENQDLQSTLTKAMRNPSGLSSNEECSSSNTCEYNVQSEIEELKKRVALVENITDGLK